MTTATRPTKLDTIAAAMCQHIERTGAAWVHQRLAHGLELVLQRRLEPTGVERWRLALGREGVQPSEDEVAICRKSFGVPDATDHSRRQLMRTGAKTGKKTIWHIVEMTWLASPTANTLSN